MFNPLDLILLHKAKKGGGGGVTPTGTISITQNGEVDVTNYAKANVNVSSFKRFTVIEEQTIRGVNAGGGTYIAQPTMVCKWMPGFQQIVAVTFDGTEYELDRGMNEYYENAEPLITVYDNGDIILADNNEHTIKVELLLPNIGMCFVMIDNQDINPTRLSNIFDIQNDSQDTLFADTKCVGFKQYSWFNQQWASRGKTIICIAHNSWFICKVGSGVTLANKVNCETHNGEINVTDDVRDDSSVTMSYGGTV